MNLTLMLTKTYSTDRESGECQKEPREGPFGARAGPRRLAGPIQEIPASDKGDKNT